MTFLTLSPKFCGKRNKLAPAFQNDVQPANALIRHPTHEHPTQPQIPEKILAHLRPCPLSNLPHSAIFASLLPSLLQIYEH